MPANKNQRKHILKIDLSGESIFMQVPRPKRSTVIIFLLVVLLGIVLFIAIKEPELHSKALNLVISIIEAILTFFSASPKSK